MRTTLTTALLVVTAACNFTPQTAQDAGPKEPATTLPDGGTATWYRDVAPLAQAHCQQCHVAGGIAPFSVERYEQVKNWHAAIASSVTAKRMPPWSPDERSCGQKLQGSRTLTQAEIDVFNAWSAAGGPEGDPKDAPPAFVAKPGLEWVDQQVAPKSAYTPSTAKPDDYRCFVIDPALTAEKNVVGFEIVPGERSIVHHVLVYAVERPVATQQDAAEAGEGWTCFGGPGSNDAILIGGWVPGTSATRYPAGTGIPLPKDRVLVMQIHYNTQTAGAKADLTTMRLQYARSSVIQAALVPILDFLFYVPPRAMGFTPAGHPKKTQNTLGDARVWGAFPHMHTKGKRITVAGPDGCWVDIPKWDFQWQQQYFFDQPVLVKANAQVSISCTWDNPTDKAVTWGEGTDDEMCLSYLYVTK